MKYVISAILLVMIGGGILLSDYYKVKRLLPRRNPRNKK